MHERLKLGKEKRAELILAIKNYFLQERDEDLGDLAAGLFLDFFIEELAPHFYNLGVEDSYQYLGQRLEDLLGIQIY